MPEPVVVVALLAAGASRRLGAPKQVVTFDGVPLLRRHALMALAASIGPVVVIVGSREDLCRGVIVDLPVDIRVNARWAEGMAIIPSRLFSRLEMLAGDVGARSIVTSREESVCEVDLPRAAFDIDHPEDLAGLSDQRAVPEVLRNRIADLA
jgi:molybdenum cofactor cytidylyltransferase